MFECDAAPLRYGGFMEALFGKTYQLLSNMLDYRSSRHQVITSNVTNLDTPGFKPKDLKFPEELKKEMNSAPASLVRTDPRHIASQKNSTGKKYEVVETGEKSEYRHRDDECV